MAVRILGTGVVLLPAGNADGEELPIAAEVFVDYDAGRGPERVGGNFMTATVRLDADPTTDSLRALPPLARTMYSLSSRMNATRRQQVGRGVASDHRHGLR